MKKPIYLLLLTLLVIPITYADSCGITNLASCLPEKMAEYLLTLINMPLQPMTESVKNLLTTPVDITLVKPLWTIVIYIISILYGLYALYAGFTFMLAGYSAEKRMQAKEWLKNVVLMIFFVNASYYLYYLLMDMSALLTSAVLSLVDENFFLLTVDNLPNLGMEMLLSSIYLLMLVVCTLLFALRYMIMFIGVIFFPLAIFLHFTPPLKAFGKLIMNTILIIMFLPFFQALLILASSMLMNVGPFENAKMLIMICTYLLISTSMLFLVVFALVKSAFAVTRSDVGKAVVMISKGG